MTTETTATDPRYPIGPFRAPESMSEEDRQQAIQRIGILPAHLRAAVEGLTDGQLDTPYREDGWTVRQVVHHVVDSHLNAYIRFKTVLTEDRPTIRPYDQDAWSNLADASDPLEGSLRVLEALHGRWERLLISIEAAAWHRPFIHPESGEHTLEWLLALYAWHGDHHVAHVTRLRAAEMDSRRGKGEA
ncbi:MAG: YfiT family bacillithiol transferase [Acidobacteriota bacterium]